MKAILVLTALGIFVLLAEIFRLRRALFPLVVIGLLGALGAAVSYWFYTDGGYAAYFGNMISFDDSSVLTSGVILVTALLWVIMSKDFFGDETNLSDHYSLVVFSLVGAVILTCYTNMVMLFLGIEILSIPLYVLAGSRKNDLASNESAFKYFLMGAFASGFLLFGITLIYGATGHFDLANIGLYINTHLTDLPLYFYSGILLLLVGLLFKISAVPFHFWAPDVYQGAPTSVTAFMSTIVKTAAIVAIMRLLLTVAFAGVDSFWNPVIAVCAGLSFVIGNITAVVQDKVKRLLAYSSISHAGFLLLAIAADTRFSSKAIIYYVAGYSIASIIAFTVLLNVMRENGDDSIEGFNGLGKRNPLLAVAMTIALFSLAGIPPTAGFFGKYYVFTAALASIKHPHNWLVVLGILGSLVGVYYYFRIIIAMFFRPAANDSPVSASGRHQALLFITAVIVLVLGLLPDLILSLGTITQEPSVVQISMR